MRPEHGSKKEQSLHFISRLWAERSRSGFVFNGRGFYLLDLMILEKLR